MHSTLIVVSLMFVGQPPVTSSSRLVVDAQASTIKPLMVPAKEAGILTELNVTEGDLVVDGQAIGFQEPDLAQIERQLALLELDIARLQSENDVDKRFAKVALEVALADMGRYEQAISRYAKAVTLAEMDRQKLVVERSRLSIEQADRDLTIAEFTKQLREQKLRGADKHLENRTVESSISGQVVQILAHPGEWLNPGDPIVRIVQVKRLRVECQVDGQVYAAQQLLGRPVVFTVKLPPEREPVQFEGEVVFVHPELNAITKKGSVFAEVDNADLRLRPGMSGQLTILLEEGGAEIQ